MTKYYVILDDGTEFVCMASDPTQAIAKLWQVDGDHGRGRPDALRASYWIHEGQTSAGRRWSSIDCLLALEPTVRQLIHFRIIKNDPHESGEFTSELRRRVREPHRPNC